MEKLGELKITALPGAFNIEEFRKSWNNIVNQNIHQDSALIIDGGKMMLIDHVDILKKEAQLEVLRQHIEHPTKPGYKRSDIVKHIKELENELKKIK